MSGELGTTNLFLGIIAGVSVLEALVIFGIGLAGVLAYRKVTALIDRAMLVVDGIEARQVAPAMQRVNAILDDVKDMTADVKDVTARVNEETERVDRAIHMTIGRIDDTADRMRAKVRVKTSTLVGFIRGARVALEALIALRT